MSGELTALGTNKKALITSLLAINIESKPASFYLND